MELMSKSDDELIFVWSLQSFSPSYPVMHAYDREMLHFILLTFQIQVMSNHMLNTIGQLPDCLML